MNIVVFISGQGTNLQEIVTAINNKIIPAKITHVISNKTKAGGLVIAKENNIPFTVFYWDPEVDNRQRYNQKISDFVSSIEHDLIVLAGWMHVFSGSFLKNHSNIINLHPALPGCFPGTGAIRKAYNAFKRKEITYTGCMVHRVIAEIDAGEVLNKCAVSIYDTDEYKDLENRVKYFEKSLLVSGINKALSDPRPQAGYVPWHRGQITGKVRDIYDIGCEVLVMVHSDRLSAFDQGICDIPSKGAILTKSSEYWFDKTRHIVKNHLLHVQDNVMFVKKATTFPIEFVVRGYITGNTSTSLWTHYNKGVREYCGRVFPDGLVKNQQLYQPVLTPTTKSEFGDQPISPEEIVEQGYMSQDDLDYVSGKSLELYKYGAEHSRTKGLILVDTKYEFGKDKNGEIMLIDEIHTCDSSRFWRLGTYDESFSQGHEPEKLDKDCIRDYVKSVCDPYVDNIPVIPGHMIDRVWDTYNNFYLTITGGKGAEYRTQGANDYPVLIENYLRYCHNEIAIIVAGSLSDSAHVVKISQELGKVDVASGSYYSSAHKNTEDVLEIIKNTEKNKRKVIWIAVAGMSNALGGVLAANSRYPVISCPPFKDNTDMLVNVQSSLQCPSKVPVSLILRPDNVASTVRKIFDLDN